MGSLIDSIGRRNESRPGGYRTALHADGRGQGAGPAAPHVLWIICIILPDSS